MFRFRLPFVFLCLHACFSAALLAAAQDAEIGVSMPVTVTGELLATHRLQTFAPGDSNLMGAARVLFYPSVKLGAHWFGYSAIQLKSEPFYYYDTYYPRRGVDALLLQGFIGYTRSSGNRTVTFKAGKLQTAFGSYPLRYDDAANPLLDVPPDYGIYLGLLGDRLPCGVPDLLAQHAIGFVHFSCGGINSNDYGVWPTSLYGLPGAEVDLSIGRFDTRFQLTNSSPVYPLNMSSNSQHAQWAAGAGYTVRQGLHIGGSAFRGPFLQENVEDLLPAGEGPRDYPATGLGVDAQWARGRFSTTGEWQWHQFDFPNFLIAPAIKSGYVEVKATLTPRFYTAFRAAARWHNEPEDAVEKSTGPFQPNLQTYEMAVGFHVDHFQTLKLGYEWMQTKDFFGNHVNVLGMQFVTSIDSLSKALH